MLNDFYINRDDLIKTIKGIGDTIYNTSVEISKIFSELNFESIESLLHLDLYYYPNNRRRFKGEPLVRNRAFAKAYKNERRK